MSRVVAAYATTLEAADFDAPLRVPATNHKAVDDNPTAQTATQDSRMHIFSEQRRPDSQSPGVVGPPRSAWDNDGSGVKAN